MQTIHAVLIASPDINCSAQLLRIRGLNMSMLYVGACRSECAGPEDGPAPAGSSPPFGHSLCGEYVRPHTAVLANLALTI